MTDKHWKRFLVFTLAIRLVILAVPVGLSDDIYRYVWDGIVQRAGFNPYNHPPDAIELQLLRRNWWEMINQPTINTPYPPVAQFFFYLIATINLGLSETLIVIRIVMILFDLLTIILIDRILKLLQLPRRRSLYYGLNPLVLVEFAGNGHIDVIAIFFTLLSIFLLISNDPKKISLSSITVSIAILVKFFPIVFLIFAISKWRKKDWGIFMMTTAFWVIPYVGPGNNPLFSDGLRIFVLHFRFNSSLFRLIDSLIGIVKTDSEDTVRILYVISMCCVAVYLAYKFKLQGSEIQIIQFYTFFILLALLLGPEIHPWYVIWLLPTGVICFQRASILFSCLVLYSYEIYLRYDMSGDFDENHWILAIEYLPVYIMLLFEILQKNDKLRQYWGRIR